MEPTETGNAIEIESLSFAWPGGQELLRIPRFTVARSGSVFVRGASGSGKSTLLSLLAGVNLPTRGSVTVLGQPLQQLGAARRDHFRADHIGFIFQLFNLIPYLSVLENVTLPCRFSRLRRARATAAGETLEAEARRLLTHLEMADDAIIHRPVTRLSVGQQQRVATARALIGSPEIIIADEPTSALDSDMRHAFIQLLFQECRAAGSTLVFVSHDRSIEAEFEHPLELGEINQAAGGRG